MTDEFDQHCKDLAKSRYVAAIRRQAAEEMREQCAALIEGIGDLRGETNAAAIRALPLEPNE